MTENPGSRASHEKVKGMHRREIMARWQQRCADSFRLRRAGYSFPEIGKALKIDPNTAWRAYRRAMRDAYRDEGSEDLRKLEIARLDQELVRVEAFRQAHPDQVLECTDRILKVSRQRADLLGLNAPARHEHAGPGGGPIPVEMSENDRKTRINELLERFSARRNGTPAALGGGGPQASN